MAAICPPLPTHPNLLPATAVPLQVQVAFTVVRYSTEQYGQHQGVATTWLHGLCEAIAAGAQPAAAAALRLPIFLRRGGAFGPPDSLETPLIMIGPGTGVTPFRGFLQHRRAQVAAAAAGGCVAGGTSSTKGPAWLYFGCRREDQDYLYREDLEVCTACTAICSAALMQRQLRAMPACTPHHLPAACC